jgi:hypothetical protein
MLAAFLLRMPMVVGLWLLGISWPIRKLLTALLAAALVIAVAKTLGVTATQTAAPTLPRPSPPPEIYVADSNVFMDLSRDQPSGGTCRTMIDARYLRNPAVTLIAHWAILTETVGRNDINGTQSERLRALGVAGGAQIVPASATLPDNFEQMLSQSVSTVDLYVLETALRYKAPLLTTNANLGRLVRADPNRPIYQHYATVPIVDPCPP